MNFIFNFFSKIIDHFLRRFFPHLYLHYFKDERFARFLISSTVVGAVNLIFLFLFYDLLGLGLEFSTALAFILAFFVSFFLHRGWTFKIQEKRIPKQMTLYFLNTLFTLGLNVILMHWLTNYLNIWYLVSQVISNLTLGVYNFLISKFVIFKENNNEIGDK
ncbi:GtrA family protein [Candidatus Falkowbacteria bacterium]|jgi:putative flippase GtrA|nr:GtrA family protein [Patescibacteria group bacterium]MDD3434889.1 GtrA family protein [Patescibacteria group bacterium]MDD4466776.1 GtrA family protein [Patescibacteria group bacterium]NCU43029.1 GtrA family protein [Candidatus Falkowbacteria bacterium]